MNGASTNKKERGLSRRLISWAMTTAIVALLGYIGFKGFTDTLWGTGTQPRTYRIEGADKRSMTWTILPKNEVIIAYADPNEESLELVLAQMYGVYGKRYFGRFWHIERLGFLGWRIYGHDVKAVDMEIKVVNKFRVGKGDSTFPAIGKTFQSVILFSPQGVRFQDMWLAPIPSDPKLIDISLEILRKKPENG